jgi:hypothetical protein
MPATELCSFTGREAHVPPVGFLSANPFRTVRITCSILGISLDIGDPHGGEVAPSTKKAIY